MSKLKDICKMGQGNLTCRYLGFGDGWTCLKFTNLKAMLDARVAANSMRAQGDNCDGQEAAIPLSEESEN